MGVAQPHVTLQTGYKSEYNKTASELRITKTFYHQDENFANAALE